MLIFFQEIICWCAACLCILMRCTGLCLFQLRLFFAISQMVEPAFFFVNVHTNGPKLGVWNYVNSEIIILMIEKYTKAKFKNTLVTCILEPLDGGRALRFNIMALASRCGHALYSLFKRNLGEKYTIFLSQNTIDLIWSELPYEHNLGAKIHFYKQDELTRKGISILLTPGGSKTLQRLFSSVLHTHVVCGFFALRLMELGIILHRSSN